MFFCVLVSASYRLISCNILWLFVYSILWWNFLLNFIFDCVLMWGIQTLEYKTKFAIRCRYIFVFLLIYYISFHRLDFYGLILICRYLFWVELANQSSFLGFWFAINLRIRLGYAFYLMIFILFNVIWFALSALWMEFLSFYHYRSQGNVFWKFRFYPVSKFKIVWLNFLLKFILDYVFMWGIWILQYKTNFLQLDIDMFLFSSCLLHLLSKQLIL